MLFRLQKYKKFESNSQRENYDYQYKRGCFDCKSTKNLRAIHNTLATLCYVRKVVSTAKVQKIWEQFTTEMIIHAPFKELFRLQKYKKFESNSQHSAISLLYSICCFDCKSTKNLRAIHNTTCSTTYSTTVVSTAKVQKIWEQFTTLVKTSWTQN